MDKLTRIWLDECDKVTVITEGITLNIYKADVSTYYTEKITGNVSVIKQHTYTENKDTFILYRNYYNLVKEMCHNGDIR